MKAIAIATLCLAGQEAGCRVEMSFGADNLYLCASLIRGLLNRIFVRRRKDHESLHRN